MMTTPQKRRIKLRYRVSQTLDHGSNEDIVTRKEQSIFFLNMAPETLKELVERVNFGIASAN
jgi:hypothetical protein